MCTEKQTQENAYQKNGARNNPLLMKGHGAIYVAPRSKFQDTNEYIGIKRLSFQEDIINAWLSAQDIKCVGLAYDETKNDWFNFRLNGFVLSEDLAAIKFFERINISRQTNFCLPETTLAKHYLAFYMLWIRKSCLIGMWSILPNKIK